MITEPYIHIANGKEYRVSIHNGSLMIHCPKMRQEGKAFLFTAPIELWFDMMAYEEDEESREETPEIKEALARDGDGWVR